MDRTFFDTENSIRNSRESNYTFGDDRYSVVFNENNGSYTAYYYSTPIINSKGDPVERKFILKGNSVEFEGSNSKIKMMRNIYMESQDGYCILKLNRMITSYDEFEVRYENATASPTMNGVAIKTKCSRKLPFVFSLSIDQLPSYLYLNDRTAALMKDEFTPIITISVIGILKNNYVVENANIECEESGNKEYKLSVFPNCDKEEQVLFEINHHEPKLLHDTTVESDHPFMNNPFGSIAYVGNTPFSGEQWLYSRFNNSMLYNFNDKEIISAKLYIPKYSEKSLRASLYRASDRFCSLKSNWENRIKPGQFISEANNFAGYSVFDLTSEFVDETSRQLLFENGMVIIPQNNKTYVSLSTADNYLFPQIFALKYYI